MESTHRFNINNKEYPVRIFRKKIKRIIIKISRQKELLISCPLSCPDQMALKYLEKNRNWLEKALRIQEENDHEMKVKACLDYKKTYFWGRLYNLEKDTKLDDDYLFMGDTIYYPDKPKLALDRLLKANFFMIEKEFSAVFDGFSRHINQKPFLVIRKMKTRWGSCNYKTGRIAINRALIHLPPEFLNYVMIHEFSHLLYPNHSSQFKDFVFQCLPNSRSLEKEMKKYAFLLQLNFKN
ncbi:MAG: DUF45 domain-containing protein [Bacilli bacterium]|nr:DUF45 domain-containing protein [Bacilli bacterium]